ncbi:14666_t:CDS:1, partial [Funneliformis caledonium]
LRVDEKHEDAAKREGSLMARLWTLRELLKKRCIIGTFNK